MPFISKHLCTTLWDVVAERVPLLKSCGMASLSSLPVSIAHHKALSHIKCPLSPLTESCSVVSDSLQPHGLYNPWNSLGQNTGVGGLSLLQGIFPTQESNPGLLNCRWILYQLSHKRSPISHMSSSKWLLFTSLVTLLVTSRVCTVWYRLPPGG